MATNKSEDRSHVGESTWADRHSGGRMQGRVAWASFFVSVFCFVAANIAAARGYADGAGIFAGVGAIAVFLGVVVVGFAYLANLTSVASFLWPLKKNDSTDERSGD